MGHYSNQGGVWNTVARLHQELNIISPTSALSAAYEAYEQEIEEFRKDITYVEGATGLAIALDGRVRSLDLFGTAQTCSRLWPRLVAGLSLEALRKTSSPTKATVEDVLQYWTDVTQWPWEAVTTVGEGQEYRAESQRGDQGSALFYDGKVVYLSAVSRQ
ncbi:ARPP-1 family domain-containing protein [Synechococcus sp. R55.2]